MQVTNFKTKLMRLRSPYQVPGLSRGCCSGYRGTLEKASLVCLPSDTKQREIYKPAIPRQESAGFSLDCKNVHVCEEHFDPTDIIWTEEFVVNEEAVSLQHEKLELKPAPSHGYLKVYQRT
ncbi:uncharacterized protein LOC144136220 [Amblyomma americanum]